MAHIQVTSYRVPESKSLRLRLNLLKQTYSAVYERHKQLKPSTFSKHFIPTSVLQNSGGAVCHSEKGTTTWLHCQMKTRLLCCFSALLIKPLSYLEYFQVNESQIYLKTLLFRKAGHFADIKRTRVEKPYRLIVWAWRDNPSIYSRPKCALIIKITYCISVIPLCMLLEKETYMFVIWTFCSCSERSWFWNTTQSRQRKVNYDTSPQIHHVNLFPP